MGAAEPLMESASIRLEEVTDCPVCGGAGEWAYRNLADRHWGVPGAWSFRRCPKDGTLWLTPRPMEEDLPRCYPGAYFTHVSQPADVKPSRVLKASMRKLVLAGAYGYRHLVPTGRFTTLLARTLAWAPPIRALATHNMGACMAAFRPNGRLLDVGCGNGEYLLRMRGYGWEVAGIEPDAEAACVAREEFGLTVHPGPIGEAPFPAASFDVITCRHVLEHISRALPFLCAIIRLLKPGGRLIVLTPNAGSLGHRLFRSDYYSLDPPRHLSLYTTESARRLFRGLPELRVVRISTRPRIARKIFRHWRMVKKCGSFREAQVRLTPGERAACWLFSVLEGSAAPFLPVGEEIELVAKRETMG